jgi:hypothetical protein
LRRAEKGFILRCGTAPAECPHRDGIRRENMRRSIVLLALILFGVFTATAQEEQPPAAPEQQEQKPVSETVLNLGKINFPRDFIHKGNPFEKGVYFVNLIKKDNALYFQVFRQKEQPLLEELAVIKPNSSKKKFNYKLQKELLRGEEYFRISVIRPDQNIIAYFLVKKEAPPPSDK